MSFQSNNNKRIAKNTLLLYFRIVFMLVVSLFTSRVILNALGVEDFGIYNIVGEVVALLSGICQHPVPKKIIEAMCVVTNVNYGLRRGCLIHGQSPLSHNKGRYTQ